APCRAARGRAGGHGLYGRSTPRAEPALACYADEPRSGVASPPSCRGPSKNWRAGPPTERSATILAGTPAATTPSGTSRLATAWEATTELCPTRTPMSTDALLQIQLLRPIDMGADDTFS